MLEVALSVGVAIGLAILAGLIEHFGAGPPWARPQGGYQLHYEGVRVENYASLGDIERAVRSANPNDQIRKIRALPAGRWYERITVGLTLATAALGFSIVYILAADPSGRVALVMLAIPLVGLGGVFAYMRQYRDSDPDDRERLRRSTAWAITIGFLILLATGGLLAQEILNQAPTTNS